MTPLSLIDLHCDTIFELFKRNQGLDRNDCTISLETTAAYAHYAQFFACWCSTKLDDDQGYAAFLKMDDYLSALLARPEVSNHMCRVRTADELQRAWEQNKHAAILAIEDARILAGDISRMDEFARRGVRYLTLQWGGETCIGGAHDTETGLSEFGKAVTRRCFELGITPDLSHTCAQSAQDAIDIAMEYGKPVIASHSNAYSVYSHSRNLRDEHFAAIRDLGGLVGLNFFCGHLCNIDERRATVSDLVRHLEHFLSMNGENTVAIGGDWDGARLPVDITTIADAQKLADELSRLGYSDALIRKLFYQNALDFIKRSF